MTTSRRDLQDSPFGDWIRRHTELDSREFRLSVQNVDWWIHRFRRHTDHSGDRHIDSLMWVELKTFAADLTYAQTDTYGLLTEAFAKQFRTKDGAQIRTVRVTLNHEVRRVHLWGHFTLRLQGERPDDGGWINWNGHRVTDTQLVQIVRFNLNPISLRPHALRRHHGANFRARTLRLDLSA